MVIDTTSVLETTNIITSKVEEPRLSSLPLDNKTFEKRQNYCRVFMGSDQTIPNATNTVVELEDFVSSDVRMQGSSNNIVIQKPGTYLVTGNCGFEANGTGIRALVLYIDGANYVETLDVRPGFAYGGADPMGADINMLRFTYFGYMPSGTSLQLRCYQNSGGDLDVINGYAQLAVYGIE